MTPTERRRPVTRRRRLAHIGVGGVIIVAASIRLAEDPPEPAPAPAVADVSPPIPLVKFARRPVPLEASRSKTRRPPRRHVDIRPTPTPAPVAAPPPAGSVDGIPAVWVALVECEASGDWHINTGNGYTGGPQFTDQTWLGEGGGAFAPEAWEATPLEQLVVARRVLAVQGADVAWPVCGPRVDLVAGD